MDPPVRLASVYTDDEDVAAVERVIRSGRLAQGPEVAMFEVEFARSVTCGRPCVAVNSGTSALLLALLSAGVGRGDEVLVPSFTFAATANAVVLAGALPVFVDIDPVTYCMDPQLAEAAVTRRSVAMIPVHLYGHPANMTDLVEVADRHGLLLIEDACQAHGARWRQRPVGLFGGFGVFSLYATKNLTAGEGGMIVSADPEMLGTAKLLRSQGMRERDAHVLAGYNMRMSELHAALGRVQLGRLPARNARRAANAAYLSANLEGVRTPTVGSGATHVWHNYTVRVARGRDRVIETLQREFRIETAVYYGLPCHDMPHFGRSVPLPHTERAAREVLSLPVHPDLSPSQLDRVVSAVNSVVRSVG